MPKLRSLALILSFAGVLGFLVAETAAQLPTATILGVVRDSTGAVIPGVAVTATNADTGISRSGQTGSDGSYRFPALQVVNPLTREAE